MNTEKTTACDLNDADFSASIEVKQAEIPEFFKNKIVSYFTLTNKAIERIKHLLDTRHCKSSGVKISIRTKGCSGMAYKIEFADYGVNLTDADDMLIIDGIRIFVDIKASLFVIGMTMDYVVEDLQEGFVFTNPNEKGRCGCGSSFYV